MSQRKNKILDHTTGKRITQRDLEDEDKIQYITQKQLESLAPDDIYYYNRKLIFSSTQPGNYNINVYSLSGELLYHNISIIFKGKNNIDIPNYKNIVILKIIGDNRTMTKKIFNI